jgi:hypothetical protein
MRSWLAWKKTQRIARIPAQTSEIAVDERILTEEGLPIQPEVCTNAIVMKTESADD